MHVLCIFSTNLSLGIRTKDLHSMACSRKPAVVPIECAPTQNHGPHWSLNWKSQNCHCCLLVWLMSVWTQCQVFNISTYISRVCVSLWASVCICFHSIHSIPSFGNEAHTGNTNVKQEDRIMCIFRAFGLHSPLQSLLTNQQVVQTIACRCVRPSSREWYYIRTNCEGMFIEYWIYWIFHYYWSETASICVLLVLRATWTMTNKFTSTSTPVPSTRCLDGVLQAPANTDWAWYVPYHVTVCLHSS